MRARVHSAQRSGDGGGGRGFSYNLAGLAEESPNKSRGRVVVTVPSFLARRATSRAISRHARVHGSYISLGPEIAIPCNTAARRSPLRECSLVEVQLYFPDAATRYRSVYVEGLPANAVIGLLFTRAARCPIEPCSLESHGAVRASDLWPGGSRSPLHFLLLSSSG